LFEVMASVGDTSYFSEVAPAPTSSDALELPVDFYDATTDAGSLRVSQMHMVVDFFSPTLMQIAEIYIISNDGDKTVENAIELPDGQTAAVAFDLPDGAVNLSFEQGALGERFLQTETGFADTFGVRPGPETSQLIVRYYLPYEDGISIQHPLSYPTDQVGVIVPQLGVSLSGDMFSPEGSRQMGDGRVVDIFAAQNPGTQYSFTLSGVPQLGQTPQSAPDAPAAASVSGNTIRQLGIGIVVAGLLVLAVGVWWWKRNPVPDDEPESAVLPPKNAFVGQEENEVVQALLDLDAALDAGTLSVQEYERQRAALRDTLKTTLLQHRAVASTDR